MKQVNPETAQKIEDFLLELSPKMHKRAVGKAWHTWKLGNRGWKRLGLDGTRICWAICWYQAHSDKAPNNEWRPIVIIEALIQEVSK